MEYTFVTESHTTYDDTVTVNILTASDVQSIVDDCLSELKNRIFEINDDKLRIWKILDQFKPDPPFGTNKDGKNEHEKIVRDFRDAALAASTDAATARKEVKRRLDTIQSDAAKAFRSVIDETLRPILQYGLDLTFRRLGELKTENKKLLLKIEEMETKITAIENRVGDAPERKTATGDE